jgi:hypothetical protein
MIRYSRIKISGELCILLLERGNFGRVEHDFRRM